MSKLSVKSIVSTLNIASAAMQQQAQNALASLSNDKETSAEERKRIQRAAQNIAKVSDAQKTSTTHDEETRKLIALLERNDVAKFVRENGIDANAFLQHAKYGKAKLNAMLDHFARAVVPDPRNNSTNAACVLELWKKSGSKQIGIATIQRFLGHAGDTQAGYIFRFWKEFGSARVTGSKHDRVITLNESNAFTRACAAFYGITAAQQEEAEANALAALQQDSAASA